MTTRVDRLRKIADVHERWVAEHFGEVSRAFDTSGQPEGSDYNQHHVDIDADGEAEDAFAAEVASIFEPVTAAVGRKTAADPWVRDNQGQFAKTGAPDLSKMKVPELRAEAKPAVTASLLTHLPDLHDQSSHGRKGIRKPDTDITPRTRARRQSAERERRDIEAHARREAQKAVDMHAARQMAELAIEFEELAAKGASQQAMTHRVRARMRRLGLEPSVEQAGQQVTFDPDRHEVIGVRPAPGEQVLVVRPGYVWARPDGEALIERPTVIGAAPSSVTSLLTHLPGLHIKQIGRAMAREAERNAS